MFYDPTCKPETKADPYSLDGLISWLETQPPDVSYSWHSMAGTCLIGRYGNAVGIDWIDCHTKFAKNDELWVAGCQPHTLGAALNRARTHKVSGRPKEFGWTLTNRGTLR